MWNLKHKANKTKPRFIDTQNRLAISRREGGYRDEMSDKVIRY